MCELRGFGVDDDAVEIENDGPKRRVGHFSIANDGAFVTADSPLSLWSSNPPGFWGEGELTADELAFPLDPSTYLVMRHPDTDETVTDVDGARVRELNHRTFNHAHRSVFARPGSEEQTLEK